MPGFLGARGSDPTFGLLQVNLDTGRGRVINRGSADTIDWFVNKDGDVIAEEKYNDRRDLYTIEMRVDGKLRKIFERKAARPPLSIVGYKPDESALIVSLRNDGDYFNLAELTPDGKLSGPIFQRGDADVDRVINNVNRVVFGVEYSGIYPRYEFFDDELDDFAEQIALMFPDAAVTLSDWTDDLNFFIFRVAGGALAPSYHLFDRQNTKLIRIGNAYEEINDEDAAEVVSIAYKARDGVRIPSLLTRPRDWTPETPRPTIIMPHGGPESYDAMGFDWMAQYFATRGYLVLQPNFRGSDGFGAEHRNAGRGNWGRGVMQHDVTDGLNALIKTKWADPDRVCIIGASYGGYAALAGGAFTPDLYKCVAAIAPVADLPRMLYDERQDHGKDSWVFDYWKELIGDPRAGRDKLKLISPSEHADQFQVPVLLIHGNDDTVVPYRQSAIMERALKRAGKDVEMVKLKGGDHWLSTSDARLDTLRALDRFVARKIGPGAVATGGTGGGE